jgi:hypothetical protein
VIDAYVPAPHSEHTCAPMPPENLPRSHAVHTPAPEKLPAAQSAQAVAPTAKRPLPQGRHPLPFTATRPVAHGVQPSRFALESKPSGHVIITLSADANRPGAGVQHADASVAHGKNALIVVGGHRTQKSVRFVGTIDACMSQ